MSRRLRSAVGLFAALVWAAAPAMAQSPATSAAQASATSGLAGSPFPRSAFPPSPYTSYTSYAPRPQAARDIYGAPDVGNGQVVRVGTGAEAVQTLNLPRGKSAVVELPTEASDVMVSDPKVADVFLSTPRRINVLGVGSGQTDATFLDRIGRRILRLEIRVDQDTSAAADTIARLLPGASIHVQAANNNLILSGTASTPAEADRAVRLAASFVPDVTHVINMIDVTGGEQVRLEVKVVEVNRTAIKQLGFNLGAIIGQIGGPQYSFAKAATYGVAGALLGGLNGGYSVNTTSQPASAITGGTSVTQNIGSGYTTAILTNPATGAPVLDPNGLAQTYRIPNDLNTLSGTGSNANNGLSAKAQSVLTGRVGESGVNQATGMIQAFERVGLVRTLAEPNLTAISGESGKFLAGGEFPVPTGQDNNGRVTIEYKSYGVGLGYTPVVLSSGRISLKLSVEVSEISNVGGFTLASSSTGTTSSAPSLTIPGLTVRRTETTVELPSGGSFVISGLLQNQTKETLDSLPGLMQLPVLGSLFRSRDFQNNESELVMIVTPYLVKPVRPDQIVTPADGLKIASDIETNLLGRLNTGFGKKPAATAGQQYQGPFGYVVD